MYTGLVRTSRDKDIPSFHAEEGTGIRHGEEHCDSPTCHMTPIRAGYKTIMTMSDPMPVELSKYTTYLGLMADCNVLRVLLQSDILSNPRRVAGIKCAINLQATEANSLKKLHPPWM